MSFDARYARAHVRGDSDSATQEAVTAAYRDIFTTENGRMVLHDLLAAYHHRESVSVNEEAATVDHPFRAYYVEGQRSVVMALRALVSGLEAEDLP